MGYFWQDLGAWAGFCDNLSENFEEPFCLMKFFMATKKTTNRSSRKPTQGLAASKRKTPLRNRPASSQSTSDSKNEKGLAPHRWTFLTNHSHVLILLSRDPSITLREVAIQVGITERAVQRIIADLEHEGFIERERMGRQNRYRVHLDLALRHPIESHRTIGELIKAISL